MEILSIFLGVVASLVTIFTPLFSVILSKKKIEPMLSEGQVNITTINNYHYNSRVPSVKRSNETLDEIIKSIVGNHSELKKNSGIMILLAMMVTVAHLMLVAINYSDLSFISQYMSYILNVGKNDALSYLIAFMIPFLGLFLTSYFALVYYYDFILRRHLKNFGYFDHRPTLEKMQRVLIKKHRFSQFSIYPVLTVARLIENSDIRARNKRRIKSSHESSKWFFQSHFFVGAVIILFIINFTFIKAYS